MCEHATCGWVHKTMHLLPEHCNSLGELNSRWFLHRQQWKSVRPKCTLSQCLGFFFTSVERNPRRGTGFLRGQLLVNIHTHWGLLLPCLKVQFLELQGLEALHWVLAFWAREWMLSCLLLQAHSPSSGFPALALGLFTGSEPLRHLPSGLPHASQS